MGVVGGDVDAIRAATAASDPDEEDDNIKESSLSCSRNVIVSCAAVWAFLLRGEEGGRQS